MSVLVVIPNALHPFKLDRIVWLLSVKEVIESTKLEMVQWLENFGWELLNLIVTCLSNIIT